MTWPVLRTPTSRPGDYPVMTWSTDGWPALATPAPGIQIRYQGTAVIYSLTPAP
jgi:hypothetical protein